MNKDQFEHARSNAEAWLANIEADIDQLENGNDDIQEATRERIQESVLSLMVRDGWRQPGAASEDGAEEYEILLTTGGPALRIWGRLSLYDEPETAELQMQDWGTPWTRYPAPEATLLKFAQCFYFG